MLTAPPPPPGKPLQLWRCARCGQPLMRVYLAPGTVIEIICPKCREKATRSAAESGIMQP